ncbi:MAG: hypothetical protein QNK35_05110 [Bacteroides sp.]|nr:hypothetical protein [Bacteroides sp.]
MVRFYVAFDDTDTLDCGRGTGKLARWFAEELPGEFHCWGVVRQQLLNSPRIPKTSHNSALCCVIDTPCQGNRDYLIEKGISHIRRHFVEGSDPGFCVASRLDPSINALIAFGKMCTSSIMNQEEAIKAAGKSHLSGHGGSNGGIIGAAAAVGLTAHGESGRLVAYMDIRELPTLITAGELRKRRIFPISAQRHAEFIPDHHSINTQNSIRPHLSGRRLTLPLLQTGLETWETIHHTEEKSGP